MLNVMKRICSNGDLLLFDEELTSWVRISPEKFNTILEDIVDDKSLARYKSALDENVTKVFNYIMSQSFIEGVTFFGTTKGIAKLKTFYFIKNQSHQFTAIKKAVEKDVFDEKIALELIESIIKNTNIVNEVDLKHRGKIDLDCCDISIDDSGVDKIIQFIELKMSYLCIINQMFEYIPYKTKSIINAYISNIITVDEADELDYSGEDIFIYKMIEPIWREILDSEDRDRFIKQALDHNKLTETEKREIDGAECLICEYNDRHLFSNDLYSGLEMERFKNRHQKSLELISKFIPTIFFNISVKDVKRIVGSMLYDKITTLTHAKFLIKLVEEHEKYNF